ncbi:hypothetical protein Nmel_012023 [Mimus melanotis]
MGAQPVGSRLEGIKANRTSSRCCTWTPGLLGLPAQFSRGLWSPGVAELIPCVPQYPLPAPQGGKHANNPHLVEDQRFPQQRLSRKARQKTNVFDPDYLAGASPFAENDVHSRAAHLHLRDAALGAGRRRLNPNAVTKKFVRRR